MSNTGKGGGAGMDHAAIRKHVTLARKGTMHVAFALGGDGKAIVLMDKHKQPRAIMKQLQADAADAKNHRFGTLTVDPGQPTLARLVVNKAAPGMARKLVVAMKGTGVRQVEIVLEDGTSVDSAQGEEELEIDVATPQATLDAADDGALQVEASLPPSQPQQPDTAASPDADQGPDASPDASQGQDGPSAADLLSDLHALVKRMLGVIRQDPSQKAALAELATDAQASLKGGDLKQTAAAIDVLRTALDSVGPAAPAGAAPSSNGPAKPADSAAPQAHHGKPHDGKAAVQRYRKSRAVWLKTREKVDTDIRALHAKVMQVDHGGAFGDDLESQFLSVVDPILNTLDTSLAGILEDAEQATTAEATDRLLGAARARIEAYKQFVSANEAIKGLDSNPFMPMTVGKTLGASLSALEAALR